MRNRWEDRANDGLDEPVSITERQLRSLKRGARAGAFGILLALVAGGLAGWSLLGGSDGIPGMKPDVSSATTRPGPAEISTAEAATPSSGRLPGGSAPDSTRNVAAAPQATKPVAAAVQTGKPVRIGARTTKPVAAVAPKQE